MSGVAKLRCRLGDKGAAKGDHVKALNEHIQTNEILRSLLDATRLLEWSHDGRIDTHD